MPAGRLSVDWIQSQELIRFKVMLRSSGEALVTVTLCVAQKVSRGRSLVKAAAVGLVNVKASPTV